MQTALVKQKGENKPTPITTIGDQFFIRLAAELRKELAPPQLANAFMRMKAWEESLEALTTSIRDRILELLKTRGATVSDKGALEFEDGGWVLKAIPWRTGYAAKKLEALLRAKGEDPAKWMDTEVTYKVSQTKLGAAMQAEVVSADELETCRDGIDANGEQVYRVEKPKKVTE